MTATTRALTGAWTRVAVIVAILGYGWSQAGDVTSLLGRAALAGIAAVGLGLVLGAAGQIALCQASFMMVGAYTYGILVAEHGAPGILAVLAACVTGGLVAAAVSGVLRLRGYYLAVATIALALFIERVFKTGNWLPGGNSGLVGIPDLTAGPLELGSPASYLATTVAVLAVVVVVLHRWSTSGPRARAIALIHHDEDLLGVFGGDAATLKRTLFVISGVLGGLAGGLYAPAIGFIHPDGFGITESFTLALVVSIGGTRTLIGPVVGALLYELSQPILGTGLAEYRFALFGALVIVTMHASPGGWVPRLRELVPALAAREHRRGGTDATAEGPAPGRGLTVRLEGLTKAYGGFTAVDELTTSLPAGGLIGLIGPNGAGKTTTLDLIAAEQQPTAGRILVDDVDVTRADAITLGRIGVARTFQRVRLIPNLTVVENVMVGADRVDRDLAANGPGDERARRAAALAALRVVGMADKADHPIESLTFADRRLAEMARALASQPRLLLLDEPSSGLTAAETEVFADIVRRIHASGCTVVLVEHNLPFVESLVEHVVVLDRGHLLAEGPPAEVFALPAFKEAYLGPDDSSQPAVRS